MELMVREKPPLLPQETHSKLVLLQTPTLRYEMDTIPPLVRQKSLPLESQMDQTDQTQQSRPESNIQMQHLDQRLYLKLPLRIASQTRTP